MVGKKKLVSLGCTLFDLKDFVGKLFEEKVMMLSGGPLLNGRLLVKVSIVQLPNSQSIGIDPKMLTLNNDNGQQLASNVLEMEEHSPSPFSEESENEEFKASTSDVEQEEQKNCVAVNEAIDKSSDSGED